MSRTFAREMSSVPTLSSWHHRTPEALMWMWLVLFIIAMMLAMVSVAGVAEFAFVQCVLSSLAAVSVTHAGLRDVHAWARRLLPVRRLNQRIQDMAQGWSVTVIPLVLTLGAQRIWRKADLGKVWRDYETKTQELHN